jgi:mono/diheme cytochrome c family protein
MVVQTLARATAARSPPRQRPPWWRMKKKNAMFYTTIGRGDHARFMILASLLCADSVEEVEAADAYAPHLRAFIASLEPPGYPFPIDAALTEQGLMVFETNCSECHGTHGEDAAYPNLVIPLDVVGTDPEYVLAATDGRSTGSTIGWSAPTTASRWILRRQGIHRAAPRRRLGDGALSAQRVGPGPALPSRQPAPSAVLADRVDPRAYDPSVLGWEYERLQHGKSGVTETQARARVYDTTLPGYGNGGHLFGDGLTEAERTAVIEYLKML